VVGAGVPVVAASGLFYGVLSVAAPDVRCSTKRLERLLPVLKGAATRLAEHLAGEPAEGRPEAPPQLSRSLG